MKTCLLAVLTAGLLLTSCKKDDTDPNGLPKATQEGKNTFGCLVDGKVFVTLPPQAINTSSRDPLEASLYRTDILVSARGDGYVDFALRNAFQPGTYAIGETRTGSYGSYRVSAGPYYTGIDQTGTVTLTRIDTVARIAAGTFQFTGLNRNGQTVTVTEGRFDVRLR